MMNQPPRVILGRRDRKFVLRLQNIGRLQYFEFALVLPGWFAPAQIVEPPTPLPPAEPLLTLAQRWLREQKRQAAFVFLAFGVNALVLLTLPALDLTDDFTLVTFLWLASFVIFAVAVVPPRARVNVQSRRVRLPMMFAVGGIVFLALALRVWEIGTIPFTLGGDEASQGLESLRVLRGEIKSPFVTGWYSVPTMSFFFNALSLGTLGANITALRLPWVLVGAATMVSTFVLATRLAGLRVGFLTAGFLAVYHYHIHYSRLGSNQVADPLFVSLAFWFFYRALSRRQMIDWLMVGVACAGSLYFYAGARLTLILITAAIAYEFVRDPTRFWRTHRIGLLVALGTFLLVAAPILQFAFIYPDEFNARINQIGIIQSGWLEKEIDIRGESAPTILWDQFVRAALAFNYYPDRTVWYGLRTPLLDPIFGALFLVGLIYATIRALTPRAERKLFPMVAWWWGAVILGGVLTESPPSSQRLVTLTVPVCFFIAFALWKILRLARQAIAHAPVNALAFAAILLFAFISLKTYFVDFSPQRIYGSSRAELATMLAPTLNDLKATHRFYFVGAPFMYWGFATIPFLAPGADGIDLENPLTVPPPRDLISANRGAVFIVLQERIAELPLIEQVWSDGERREICAPVSGQTLATLYIVPKLAE